MNKNELVKTIVQELSTTLSNVSIEQFDVFLDAIKKANRIFVVGAGRSLLMIRGFAMRLMQSGFTSYVVGETVTPAIREGDLLIIASGSGETGTLKVMASKAKALNATLALITIYENSSIGKLADIIVKIPAPTSKNTDDYTFKSIQPGASLFEQSVLILGDTAIMMLNETEEVKKLNIGLMKLHANLE